MLMLSLLLPVLCTKAKQIKLTPEEDLLCVAHDMYEEQIKNDINFQNNQENLETEYLSFKKSNRLTEINTKYKNDDYIYEIPVIVNIVYNPSLSGSGYPDDMPNLPDSQIISVFDLVNREMNSEDPYTSSVPDAFADNVADMKFKFTIDEITRTETIKTSFSSSGNPVKRDIDGGRSPTKPNTHMNFWISKFNGLNGYAQFPGGNVQTDGICCSYWIIGSENDIQDDWSGILSNSDGNNYFGHVTTHEIGHWINLRHIWGDSSSCSLTADGVEDTPPATGPYRNQGSDRDCPVYPSKSCSHQFESDQFMNYMDYTDSKCCYMFTNGQKERAYSAMESSSRQPWVIPQQTNIEFVSFISFRISTEPVLSNPCGKFQTWIDVNTNPRNNEYIYGCSFKTRNPNVGGINSLRIVLNRDQCDGFNGYMSDKNMRNGDFPLSREFYLCWTKTVVNDNPELNYVLITDVYFGDIDLESDGYIVDTDVNMASIGNSPLYLAYKTTTVQINPQQKSSNTNPDNNGDNGIVSLNNTEIVVIVGGAVIGVLFVVIIGLFIRFRIKKRLKNQLKYSNEQLIYGSVDK